MAIVIITSLQLAIGIFYNTNTAISKAGQNCWPFRPSGLAEH